VPSVGPSLLAGLRDLAHESPLPLVVRGACMGPRLADGARVAVTRHRRYWPGDVVAFRSAEGPLLVHRLLGPWRRAGRWHLLAQGDALSRPDAPVPLDQLVGRVEGGASLTAWRDRLRSVGRWARHLARSVVR
jgi:hypothetical protein